MGRIRARLVSICMVGSREGVDGAVPRRVSGWFEFAPRGWVVQRGDVFGLCGTLGIQEVNLRSVRPYLAVEAEGR